MEQCILIIGTITHTIRARKLLNAERISARMLKTLGQNRSARGCAYGLELAITDMQRATALLDRHGIAYEWQREGMR